jgi:hypothetical protein
MKGVIPIVSALLLIIISIMGSTVTYVFINDMVGETTATSNILPIMTVEAVKTRNYDVSSVYLRNVGTVVITVDSLYMLSSEGFVVSKYSLPSPLTLLPGQLTEISLAPWSLMAPKNANYYLKVTTKEGGIGISGTFSLKKLYFGEWNEYPANPVFDPTAKAYYPSVVYDANGFSGHGDSAIYKMWFGSDSGVGYAYSNDGISWTEGANPVSGLTNAHHPVVKYFSGGFPGKNSGSNPNGATMYYRIWYWDTAKLYTVEAIRYAESPDGINWYNDQPLQNGAVPIVTGTWPDWNRGSYGPCDVLYNPTASNSGTDWTFMMYYDGTTGGDEAIGLAFSSDGVTWTGYDRNIDGRADPVLSGSGSGWDKNYVSRCTVLKVGNSYHMWYSGGDGSMDQGIGYATSNDGFTWTKDPNNPIFHINDGVSWRSGRSYCPSVMEVKGTFKMWFAGRAGSNYAIGYATAK